MPGGGSKPGERRGGRQKGTLNKRTLGIQKATEEAKKQVEILRPVIEFDPLEATKQVAIVLVNMIAVEQRKATPDPRWIKDLTESTARVCSVLMPYMHRRLATLAPAMETIVKPDGSVHITITQDDANL